MKPVEWILLPCKILSLNLFDFWVLLFWFFFPLKILSDAFFFLYKHQYSGLCFQPSWRLHLTFTSKEQEIHVWKLPFPLDLIHPQFTSNSCISWHSETCWNQYRFSRGGIQGPIFSDLPGWIVLEWWQQPPEGVSQLSDLSCFPALLPGLCFQHTSLCCLLSPPSFVEEL